MNRTRMLGIKAKAEEILADDKYKDIHNFIKFLVEIIKEYEK